MTKRLLLLVASIFFGIFLIGNSGAAVTDLKGEASFIPWSSYWWQTTLGKLVNGYQGHPSPTEKYDLYTEGHYPASLTLSPDPLWYDPSAPNWYGMCHAWVNASILENYAILPSSTRGIFFNVGDKKGLLCACHNDDEIIYKKCSRNPEYFHRYLIDYIGEKNKPIGADLDSSEEFWSYPIFKYAMEITTGEKADFVKCTISYADDLGVDPNFCGTVEKSHQYEYSLEKDEDGAYIIGGGGWRGNSVNDHPDIVWVPVAVNNIGQRIDYKTVALLAKQSGDELVDEVLYPGHYVPVVYPGSEKSFFFYPEIGETYNLIIGFDRQLSTDGNVTYLLEKNNVIQSESALLGEPEFITISTDAGGDEYKLTLIADATNEVAAALHLYFSVNSKYNYWLPNFASKTDWSGVAFSGAAAHGRVWLQAYGDHGKVMGEGCSPCELSPELSHYVKVLETEIDDDYFYSGKSQVFRLSSLVPLNIISFSGSPNSLFGGIEITGFEDHRLIIPDLSRSGDYLKSDGLLLVNSSDKSADMGITYCKDSGELFEKVEHSIGGWASKLYRPGSYPGSIGTADWAIIESDSYVSGLIMNEEWRKSINLMPMLLTHTELYVPHLALSDGWNTEIKLYNPNESECEIEIRLNIKNQNSKTYTQKLSGFASAILDLKNENWGADLEDIEQGWLMIRANQAIAGLLTYEFNQHGLSSFALTSRNKTERVLPHLACSDGWWTGISFTNINSRPTEFYLVGYGADGKEVEKQEIQLEAYAKDARSALDFFSDSKKKDVISLSVEQAADVSAIAVYGVASGESRITAINW